MLPSDQRATKPKADDLLAWYDRHRRVLPWRSGSGESADPYRVWLSEIMLQQTTVAAVKPFYLRFLDRFPTVEALAEAPVDQVMQAWAGLGYYSRARNLHACAKAVVERFGGGFPPTETELLTLPGVGAYTAAAVAAIAFNQPAAAVDGNVERVVSRLFVVEEPLPKAKPTIRALTLDLVPPDRPGDFAQAVMDLGATICTPKRPACALCPWMDPCQARAAGTAGDSIRRSRRRSPASCAAARLSWFCGPMTAFSCEPARRKGSSAAWWRRPPAPGSRITNPPAPCSTLPSRRAGSVFPAPCAMSSRISRSN